MLVDELAGQGVPRDRMVVVPPGRDVAPSSGGMPVGDLRRGRAAAVLCVANWLDRKGIVDVLDAVATLPDPTVTVHLVGDEHVDEGSRARILGRLRRPELRDRVVRHGVVAPSQMAALYSAADLFVLASHDEPYGTVYGEAMTAGLPVIGWDAGNLPHLVDDGVEGRVVRSGDLGALAAAIGELCTHEELRRHLGAQAAARSDKLPTWDDTAEQFYDVCRRAAAS